MRQRVSFQRVRKNASPLYSSCRFCDTATCRGTLKPLKPNPRARSEPAKQLPRLRRAQSQDSKQQLERCSCSSFSIVQAREACHRSHGPRPNLASHRQAKPSVHDKERSKRKTRSFPGGISYCAADPCPLALVARTWLRLFFVCIMRGAQRTAACRSLR